MEIETKSAVYKQLTGMAGTFEVAKQLCLRNYNVSLTQKNFPHVDIFAQNPKTGKSVPIQVKAQRFANPGGFDISGSCLNIPDLVVVFIAFKNKNNEMEFYIAPAKEVKGIVGEGGKRPGIARKHFLSGGQMNRWKDCWNEIENVLK